MEWFISRIIKYYYWVFKGEKIAASYLANEVRIKKHCKRIGKKLGIPDPDYLWFYEDDQLVIGKGSHICSNAIIYCHNNDEGLFDCNLRGSLNIGANVRIGLRFHADCYDRVDIGDDCLLADEIYITTSNHGMNPEMGGGYVEQPLSVGRVTLGDGCWIGARVTILPNVTIGRKCIIGTNAVVTKDIPSYSVAVGIPARVVKRYNFETHQWEKV